MRSSILPLLALALLFGACQNSPTGSDAEAEQAVEITSDSLPDTAGARYERLDQFDLTSLINTKTNEFEGGDCNSRVRAYDLNSLTLVVDSTDCGDYGKTVTYYLLDGPETVRMVHQKSVAPYYDEQKGALFQTVSERICDFQGSAPLVRARSEDLPRAVPGGAVAYDDQYDSPPWIVINAKGDDFVLDHKIDFSDDDWYTTSKNVLKDRLMGMDVLPRTIPMEFNGQTGMGIRGEFRSMGAEAIQEVAAAKANERPKETNPFARITSDLATVATPGEEGTAAYWLKRYRQLEE